MRRFRILRLTAGKPSSEANLSFPSTIKINLN